MSEISIQISEFVSCWKTSYFSNIQSNPWNVTANSEQIVLNVFRMLGSDYIIDDDIAIHRNAKIETGAVIKKPAILSPHSLIASGSYLRGGVFVGEHSIIGPNTELKSTLMFENSKLAHLNFVGDSIIGAGVNIEAGAIIANYRNECDDKSIRICHHDRVIETGVEKFGALIGDCVRIGANAVIAPGALLMPNARIGRLQLVDQSPEHRQSSSQTVDR